jgi:hypothetical protein
MSDNYKNQITDTNQIEDTEGTLFMWQFNSI